MEGVLNRLQQDNIAQVLAKEMMSVIQAYPPLLTAYGNIKEAYETQNWVAGLTQATKILRDPNMSPIIYKQLKKLRTGLRENKHSIRDLFTGTLGDTDPETIALLRAGVEFVFAMSSLVDCLKMRKVIYDIFVEGGDCCNAFLEVVDTKHKRKWGFFSHKK